MRWVLLVALGVYSASAAPTFNHDVAPILYQHCASCHRPGEVAPFPLLSYGDAAKRASQIAAVTTARFMPPWKPAPGFNEFLDDTRLSDAEVAILRDWAKAGAPEGDPQARPQPPHFSSDWSLGPPDLVLKMAKPFALPADGQDIYQCFVLPSGLTADQQVSAMEVRPGNRKVVHHAIIYLDASGTARQKDSEGNGYRCFGGPGLVRAGSLGGWAPGSVPRRLPDGVAKPLAKGTDIVAQIHYHPSGKPEEDQTSIGLYFAKTPVTRSVYNVDLVRRDIHIPAGDPHYRLQVDFTLPIAIKATGVTPHMHLLGKQMKVTATLPSGEVKPIIWIKDWDFNWQGQYVFKTPMLLPAGTRLEMEAIYDNSSANVRNPHTPPQDVHWGESTTDEMSIAFLQFESPNPNDRLIIWRALIQQLGLRRRQ